MKDTFETYEQFNESVMDKFLPESVKILSHAFMKSGKTLYVVGGAVRDFLMGKTPKDFDLVTDALPNQSEKIVKKLGYKVLDVGKKFNIVIAVKGEEEFEIATFREDTSSGRKPNVKTSTIEGDVKRRDLTINALFYDITNDRIVDLVGGEADIKTGTIRMVGDPLQRFGEDALRKLRAIRFFARSGQRFDKATEDALKSNTELDDVSPERIKDEFEKGIQQSKNPKIFVEKLNEFGYLDKVFPNLQINRNFCNSRYVVIQLFNLLKNNTPSVIEQKLNELKWSKHQIQVVKWLIEASNEDDKQAYHLLRKRDSLNITKDLVKELAKYSKNKNWYNRLMSFDLSLIDKKSIASLTSEPSQVSELINKAIITMW